MKRLALILLLSGCASAHLNDTPAGITVTTIDRVKDCQTLGDIHGISGRYGLFAAAGMADAREDALSAAKKLGANTVVFEPFASNYGSTTAHGYAYKC